MNDAMRNRGVLVLICVLVALVSSFCFGKQSLAKQPAKAPEPVGSAGSSRPASHSPAVAPNARRPAPAAKSKPARWEPADRRPLSRPTHQRPIERPAPAGRHVPGPRHLAEPPGGQGAPFGHKPVPEQRPAHEPPGLREHGRGLGPKEPVGPNPVRHHPRPEQANKGHLSRPVQERPAPRTKSHYPHQSKDTGPREGAGPPDQPGKPASPPGRENVHPGGKGLAGPPEHGAAAGRKPDQKGGGRAHTPTIPREERPVHTGTLASAPDGGPSSIGKVGTEGPAGHQPPAQPLGSHARDSDIGSGAEPSHPQATISDPRSMDLRREEPDGAVGHAPALRPGLQAAKSSQTLGRVRGRDAVSSAAPPGEKPRPAGEQAQLAPETPLGSTKLLFDPCGKREVPWSIWPKRYYVLRCPGATTTFLRGRRATREASPRVVSRWRSRRPSSVSSRCWEAPPPGLDPPGTAPRRCLPLSYLALSPSFAGVDPASPLLFSGRRRFRGRRSNDPADPPCSGSALCAL